MLLCIFPKTKRSIMRTIEKTHYRTQAKECKESSRLKTVAVNYGQYKGLIWCETYDDSSDKEERLYFTLFGCIFCGCSKVGIHMSILGILTEERMNDEQREENKSRSLLHIRITKCNLT